MKNEDEGQNTTADRVPALRVKVESAGDAKAGRAMATTRRQRSPRPTLVSILDARGDRSPL
jgi:hypothetical protein